MSKTMTSDQIEASLRDLPAWSLEEGKLHRDLSFGGFSEALGFLVRVGIEAEKMGHHPELRNVYADVSIDLTTHDAGGITEKDADLARRIEELLTD